MLTKVMAKEWGRYNIRVNAVAPGAIHTRLHEADPPGAAREAAVENQAIQRRGESEEVAAAVLFLASDAASFVTGETLLVDGGMLVGPNMFTEKT